MEESRADQGEGRLDAERAIETLREEMDALREPPLVAAAAEEPPMTEEERERAFTLKKLQYIDAE